MADSKITALTAISTVDPTADPLVIVDVSDTSMAASGTTKKSTINQLLGSGGTATLASATITGDLTVDTNTLKVDSANDLVGVGTASPNGWGAKLVSLRSTTGISFTGVWNDGVNSPRLEIGHTSTGSYLNASSSSGGSYSRLRFQVAGADQYQIDTSGVFTWYDGAGGTRMTLNANGLGIGGTPQAWDTSYKGVQVGLGANFYTNAGTPNNGWFATNTYQNASNQTTFIGTGYGMHYRHLFGEHAWLTSTVSGSAGVTATMNQLMTLDASGRLIVGRTTALNGTSTFEASANALSVNSTGATNIGNALVLQRSVADGNAIIFINQGNTVGTVSLTASATAYNTSSDYRLKEDVKPLVGGLTRVNALKPSIYKWKTNSSNGEGFLAHELAEVVPLAVTGEKDAVNEDGSIKPQGVDLSKVVPVLVAAIQELAAEVNALKNA